MLASSERVYRLDVVPIRGVLPLTRMNAGRIPSHMTQLFRRKPIADLLGRRRSQSLKRVMGAGDLIMLAIGAVIGAGIFGAIGTAAAGQVGPNGEVIRHGAGPALVFSFVLLGVACALAGLCYAELAVDDPAGRQRLRVLLRDARRARRVDHRLGPDSRVRRRQRRRRDLVGRLLQHAAAAASASRFPPWLTTGYRTALLSSDPAIHGLLQTRAAHRRHPDRHPRSGVRHRDADHVAAAAGRAESATANNIMVAIKLLALGLFIAVGATHLHAANYHPFAPNGFTRHPSGRGDRLLRLHRLRRDLDGGRGDEEPAAEPADRHPRRARDLHGIYVIVGAVLTGMVPYKELAVADPLARALQLAGFNAVGWIVALGAVVSMSAVLLVFQYGQPRIFFAMARDGLLPQWAAKLSPRTKIPATTTLVTGVFVAVWSLFGDAGETYDLTNIGTLFAFMLVSIGVLVLRYKEPDRPRPFRVPFVWPVTVLSAAGCLFIMKGLPRAGVGALRLSGW